MKFIFENWELLSAFAFGVLEIVLRLTPTDKNYSLLERIFKLLDKIVPNIRKDKTRGWTKLIFLFAFVNCLNLSSSFAQTLAVNKAFFSTNVTDTAFIQTSRTNLETNNGNTGGLYFDKVRDKWRVWTGSAWADLATGTAAATPPAGSNTWVQYNNNGLFGATSAFTLNLATSRLTTPAIKVGTVPSSPSFGDIYRESNNIINIVGETNPGVNIYDDSGVIRLGMTGSTFGPVVAFTGLDFGITAGAVTSERGQSIIISGGNADGGNNNGGNIRLVPGARTGSGSAGDVIIATGTATGGYLIINSIPTSAAGLPSGAVWSNAGVLTIVP